MVLARRPIRQPRHCNQPPHYAARRDTTYEHFRHQPDTANAAHAVACVNACEGMDPAAVPGMAGRLERAERIIGRLLPISADVLNVFGKHLDAERSAELTWGVDEAREFLKSNRSHV